MKLTKRFLVLSIVTLATIFPVTALLCGVERWPVKVCKDTQVKKLFQNNNVSSGQLNPAVNTNVSALRALPVPAGALANTRKGSGETTIWTIDATIFKYKKEGGAHGDSDYHLAIKNAAGKTMIAEIPDPGCLTNTPEPLKDMITQARADFDAVLTATGSFKATNKKVRLTGPGLFDKIHGQLGVAPNGIEIHPVIKIEFLP